MGLAFWNDLSRHWSRLLDWLEQQWRAPERGASPAAPLLLAIESAVAPGVALLRGDAVVAERACAAPRCRDAAARDRRAARRTRASRSPTSTPSRSRSGPGSFTGLRVGARDAEGPRVRQRAPGGGGADAGGARARRRRRARARRRRARRAPRRGLRGRLRRAGRRARASWLPEGVYATGGARARSCAAPCRVVGEGARAGCASALRARSRAARRAASGRAFRRAAAVGGSAARLLAAGAARIAAAGLVPRYVRRAEAEVRRTGAARRAGRRRRSSRSPAGRRRFDMPGIVA